MADLKNEDFKVPGILKAVAAVLVVLFTAITSFFISIYAVGYEFNFNPAAPVSYLLMLPGMVISLIASYLVPAVDLKGTLMQAGIWAAPILLVQEGFKGLIDPVAYLIPCGMITGALLGFILNRKMQKSRNTVTISIIMAVVLSAGLPLYLVYQHNSLQPASWAEIESRKPDMTTAEILGTHEEDGKLIISVRGDLLTDEKDVSYSQVDVVVDQATIIYKHTSAGNFKVSRDELLKAGQLVIWFSGGSAADSNKYRGTAETIVIE